MYQERFYRDNVFSKFKLEISYKESDLLISTDKKIDDKLARDLLKKYYDVVAEYVEKNPSFLSALSPIDNDSRAPSIIKDMIQCAKITGIGPFASVAGAISFYVGQQLRHFADEVIIENGGDIFLKINEDKRIGVYLGEQFSTHSSSLGEKVDRVFLKIKKRDYSFGIASSSSFIGHSLNFGKADLVTVIAKNAVFADSFATALSNRVKKEQNVEEVLTIAQNSPFIEGILIAFQGKVYLWGDLEIDR
jgi:ApbE superfamily uncharacterized protein (UPF0280 family)